MTEFVKFFFELQTNIKLYHWNTTSFSRHKGADELVDSIIELGDKFMEIYIGKYERPNKIKSYSISNKTYNDKSIIEFLNNCIKHLQILSKQLSPQDTDLLNIRDEILGKLNQTLYLFSLN